MAKKDRQEKPNLLPGETLAQYMVRELASKLNPDNRKVDPVAEELERCRELCRKGNPFPLIAMQWPNLVLTDPDEIAIFAKSMRPDRLENLTENIVAVCTDPSNPPLRLDWWQKVALAALFDATVAEICEKGATKVGKGASTSMGINLWFDVWPECKIVLTSQRAKHAQDVIFGETLKWFCQSQRMAYPREGARATATEIKDTGTHYVTIANPESGEGFSGQHGPRTLFVFDEASSVPDGFYDDAGKQASKILALANPRVLSGWFRNLYKTCIDENRTQVVDGPFGKRLCMTIDGAECMNVAEQRLEKPLGPPGGIEISGSRYEHNRPISMADFAMVQPLIPEQCDYGRHMGIRLHPDPNHVAVMAHGHFPKEDMQRQVILDSWLKRHVDAWVEGKDDLLVDCFGFDIARSLDGDSTCFTAGGKKGCREIHAWQYDDTTFHVNKALELASECYGIVLTAGRNPVCVDMDGLGAGVGDQLKQMGVWVVPFRGNAASEFDPKTYSNTRAEAYAMLGRRLNPNDQWRDETWAIPHDVQLFQELVAPEKVFSQNDALKFRVSPKSPVPGREGQEKVLSVKEKLGRSPDKADSVVYLYHAVRIFHSLDEWVRSLKNRKLLCYPASAEDVAAVRKIETEKTPPPKSEWDDVPFDWAPKPAVNTSTEPRKVVVTQPDKHERKPWWHRYVK